MVYVSLRCGVIGRLTAVMLGLLPACTSLESSRLAIPTELSATTKTIQQIPDSQSIPEGGLSSESLREMPPLEEWVLAQNTKPDPPLSLPSPPAEVDNPLPITLGAALRLTGANALDIQIADERVRIASAQLARAQVLWLPSINLGVDYFRHDGQIQDVIGHVFTTSRSSLLLGAGPQATVSLTDAVYAPLAARQVERVAQADAQATRNDTTLAVALAYFQVQQARGEVAGALDTWRRAEELAKRTQKLAPDLAPELEVHRAKAEAARLRQVVESAYERWQTASAELSRLLRLPPGTLLTPIEDPALTIDLIVPQTPLQELIALSLSHRPELASYQAAVQAALVRLQQEQRRPFYPTVVIRGVGSYTAGLAGGYFGGGINDDLQNFNARFSVDLQAIWELEGLGLGNRARIRERQAEYRKALLELQRSRDIVAADVVQAHAQMERSIRRLQAAQEGVRQAQATVEKILQGLGQTRQVGGQQVLVFRPQEAVAAVIAIEQAYRNLYQAVADYNRAQFRLYRALGYPAQALIQPEHSGVTLPGTTVPQLPITAPQPVSVFPPLTAPQKPQSLERVPSESSGDGQ
ncbi:MAG: membrane protein [Gemmataceae bacterium]|nr:MAG: membrane protein [Gemmataceae bacterium]